MGELIPDSTSWIGVVATLHIRCWLTTTSQVQNPNKSLFFNLRNDVPFLSNYEGGFITAELVDTIHGKSAPTK